MKYFLISLASWFLLLWNSRSQSSLSFNIKSQQESWWADSTETTGFLPFYGWHWNFHRLALKLWAAPEEVVKICLLSMGYHSTWPTPFGLLLYMYQKYSRACGTACTFSRDRKKGEHFGLLWIAWKTRQTIIFTHQSQENIVNYIRKKVKMKPWSQRKSIKCKRSDLAIWQATKSHWCTFYHYLGTATKGSFLHGLLFTTATTPVSPAALAPQFHPSTSLQISLFSSEDCLCTFLPWPNGHSQKGFPPPRSIVHNCIGGAESCSSSSAALNSAPLQISLFSSGDCLCTFLSFPLIEILPPKYCSQLHWRCWVLQQHQCASQFHLFQLASNISSFLGDSPCTFLSFPLVHWPVKPLMGTVRKWSFHQSSPSVQRLSIPPPVKSLSLCTFLSFPSLIYLFSTKSDPWD